MNEQEPQEDNSRLAGGMLFLMWGLFILLLMMFFDNWFENERNPNQSIRSIGGEVVLHQNRYGQYHATGKINGREVEFLVDTGAYSVSVPEHIARDIGLKKGVEISFSTAGGIVTGYRTNIDSVSLGELSVYNLRGSINPNVDDDYVLLGMTFLKNFEFTQRDDQLIIRGMQ